MRPLLLALLAVLALPSVASAALTSAGKVRPDDQFSRFTLPVQCEIAPDDTAGCTATFTISIQYLGPYPDHEPRGPYEQVDTKTVSAPGVGRHDVVVETDEVIKRYATRGGPFFVLIEGPDYYGRAFADYGKVGFCDKEKSLLMPYSGPGRLVFQPAKAEGWDRIAGPVTRKTFMISNSQYAVEGGAISYSHRGVTYTLAKGAKFGVTCTGNTSTAGGRGVLSPYLYAGRVSVKSDAKDMTQPAAWVVTPEGNLGTRAKETTSFSVSRKRSVSTLAMQKGKAGTITPWNSRTRSPCRAGEKLSVNRKGVIS